MRRHGFPSLAGSTHVTSARFFNSDDERYRVLLPFTTDDFERGDKAIHVVNSDQSHDHLHRLVAAGRGEGPVAIPRVHRVLAEQFVEGA